MKFLLRKKGQISMPTERDGEMKTFLFTCNTAWLEEIRDFREGFDADLFEDLRGNLFFYEFLIQLFREQYDVFIASVDFELKDIEYRFSDTSCEYTYWIDKDEPRIIIAEDHGRIEMDIYQFDQYEHYHGMDTKNYEFTLLGNLYNQKERF